MTHAHLLLSKIVDREEIIFDELKVAEKTLAVDIIALKIEIDDTRIEVIGVMVMTDDTLIEPVTSRAGQVTLTGKTKSMLEVTDPEVTITLKEVIHNSAVKNHLKQQQDAT